MTTKDYVWKLGIKYNPDQPRIPAGQSGGGQWTSDAISITWEASDAERKQYMTEWRDFQETLGGDQQVAFEKYTEHGFERINGDLREGKPNTDARAMMDSFVPIGRNATLYRGIGKGLADKLAQGDVSFTDRGFISGSISAEKASAFMGGEIPTLVKINVSPNTRVAYGDRGDLEIIIYPGTSLSVTGITTITPVSGYWADAEVRIIECEVE